MTQPEPSLPTDRHAAAKDVAAGIVLVLVGVGTLLYALTALRVGTLRQMGPGMFPAAIGAILAIFGAAIALTATRRAPETIPTDLRTAVAALGSIIVFGVLLEWVGAIPAIFALSIGSSLASSRIRPLESLVVAAVISVVITVLFRYGLSMNIPIFKWPF